MTDFAISGWAPDWRPAHEQLDLQRSRLKSLCGTRIVDSWLVWNLEHDKWFADLPVILTLDDGRQLEVSWEKFDDLSITWNTIDVSITPIAWVTWPLIWRSQGHHALAAVTGNIIREVASTQHRFSTRQIALPPATGAATSEVWLTGGIWIGTEDGGLHIFNALDENGLSNEPIRTDPDNRVHLLQA